MHYPYIAAESNSIVKGTVRGCRRSGLLTFVTYFEKGGGIKSQFLAHIIAYLIYLIF
jgi:hypothetical protein